MKKSLAVLGLGALLATNVSAVEIKPEGHKIPYLEGKKVQHTYKMGMTSAVCGKETKLESYYVKAVHPDLEFDKSVMKYSIQGNVYMYSVEEAVCLYAIIDNDGDDVFETKLDADEFINNLILKKDMVPDWVKKVKNKENCK